MMKIMSYSSVYCIISNDGKKYFIGDYVTLELSYKTGVSGIIEHISAKGLYLDIGKIKNEYISFEYIRKIKRHRKVI